MSLKPWREIARPHKDVLEGTFQQSEFAADISQVANGTATPDYQDAEKFYARTYITEGMRLLLISVARRLAGQCGDPVIQLQTAFGGGKTHTMLAVYHLASRSIGTEKLFGIPPLLDEAGIDDLPRARIAVLDGIRLSPSHVRQYGNSSIHTLWGELAYQLLGEQGYQLVAASDSDGTSPGKAVLTELISKAAPCVILIDELVAYIRQLEPSKQYQGGTFDSNISFIQALTEALKTVPNAIMLASLPESDLEVGGDMGRRALNSLEKYFARVESVWKPVGSEEAFEIVRRRLFETAGERASVEGIARQFSDFYRHNAEKFPLETQSNEYFERLCSAYPIHPEIFDRLYQDWSTLEKFQRTRGVLQYMAIVIHRLWNSDNKDALIMPGTLPLADSDVRNKSIHYLPLGWEPVIEREVDGSRSVPYDIDGHNTLFGSVQAARRTARTIFLGSAPSSSQEMIRGIEVERILLGSVQPGQAVGVFEDVLRRLRDKLHHLYADKQRYWLDTKPNLRREMESRKQTISERDELQPLLKSRVSKVFGNQHSFAGIHVFTPSADVPDDYGSGPRLVVLPDSAGWTRGDNSPAVVKAEEILRNRGEQPRLKQNRLIFLAPDYDVVNRLKDQARVYLAWKSIVDDIEHGTLNQDLSHLNQARSHLDGAEQSLKQLVREAYKWLLVAGERFDNGKPGLIWECVSVSITSGSLVQSIEQKLREEDWVIYEWSPVHLHNLLRQWYFKDEQTETNALKVWQDCCHYLYLPRIHNDQVFRSSISQGIESEDYFGFATGKEGYKYLGFAFGKPASVYLDESSLLIESAAAKTYQAKHQKPEPGTDEKKTGMGGGNNSGDENGGTNPGGEVNGSGKAGAGMSDATDLKRFYGSTTLDPVTAAMDFSTIMNEVVQQFTARPGVNVKISVEVEAISQSGFDETVQRTVKENCNVLKFITYEFEKDED